MRLPPESQEAKERDAALRALVEKAKAAQAKLSAVDKALANADQRQSYVRGYAEFATFDDDAAVLAAEVRRLRKLLGPLAEAYCEAAFGDLVAKHKGSEWHGRVCGLYCTSETPIGYAVESSAHRGSVQIYPASALAFPDVARALRMRSL